MLLFVTFLIFIGNGLPNSLLGAAWSAIAASTGAPIDAAGTISMIMMIGPVVMNMSIAPLRRRFSTVTLVLIGASLATVSIALHFFASSVLWLYLLAFPLGMGLGLVDGAVSLYVTNKYEARHISWLNCCWGAGSMVGPVVMSVAMTAGMWQYGYLAISLMQAAIVVAVFLSVPMWKKSVLSEESPPAATPFKQFVRRPVVAAVIFTFFLYLGIELGFGLWGSTYLIEVKGYQGAAAALTVSVFYGAITVGRFLTGFITKLLSNLAIIRLGIALIAMGTLSLIFTSIPPEISFGLYGLGCAPIFPCSLQEMKTRFGKGDTAAHMGFVVGISRLGLTFLPAIMGGISSQIGFVYFPHVVLVMLFAMFLCDMGATVLGRQCR